MGNCWDHVALEAQSKFAVAVVSGPRTLQSTRALIGELAQRTDHQTSMLLTSDEYKPYRRALLEVYGDRRPQPRRFSVGRPPQPRLTPPAGLLYATVHKHRRRGRVVGVTIEHQFGSEAEVAAALQHSPVSDHVNIAFVERYNATERHLNARKTRKLYRFSKQPELHEAMTHMTQGVYNFCRAHHALRVRDDEGRWRPRSPAVAQGITDHIWTMKEFCLRQACPP